MVPDWANTGQVPTPCHLTHSGWLILSLSTLKKSIVAISLMKNIRKFQLANLVVDADHWSAIVALPSFDDLGSIIATFWTASLWASTGRNGSMS